MKFNGNALRRRLIHFSVSYNWKPALKMKAILPILVSLIICQMTRAVSPAPGGGYPGGNTATGQNALLSLTSGTYNTGVGLFSLVTITDGNFCTGNGAGTLLNNTADQNTATGAGALFSNTEGEGN